MEEPVVVIDRSHRHCTVLCLNRPAKRNALTIDLMDQLCKVIEETQNRPEQRAIIFKGAGSAFCSGLDLAEAANMSLEEQSSKCIGRLLRTIYECPLVTIAAVHGAVLAGGLGLMAACDLAVAETGTQFGLPETRRGMVAAQIMPFVMRLLPRRVLHEMIFIGETIDARRAYDFALINKVAATYSSLPEALKWAESIQKGAPQATSLTKKLMGQVEYLDFDEALKIGLEVHRDVRHGDESKEGMQAFLEERPPDWSRT